ncbi:MAG: hypothetical protein JXQ73_26015 [Phycisphaerae bacterium]|nr:hypothetical protein [Phycisphaerae bacterium]
MMISGVTSPAMTMNRFLAAVANPRVAAARRPDQPEGAAQNAPVDPASAANPVGKTELTEEDLRQIQELRDRDASVRQHEQAHKAAAGAYSRGAPSYSYEQGPDGKRYAVEGEVQIDLSEVPGDPQATITKMQQVRRAALAPADPSSQDRQVAAKAASIEQQARAEMAQQRADEAQNPDGDSQTSQDADTPTTQDNPSASSDTGHQEPSPDRPDATPPNAEDIIAEAPSGKSSLLTPSRMASIDTGRTATVGRFIDARV